jgi:hypothetical protein
MAHLMSLISLIMWIVTALAGLFLLAIWLIEYDPDFQTAAATRLPVPVVSGHVLLAVGGLAVWIGYLLTDSRLLGWITLADLAVVATLGLTMAIRWIGVYQAKGAPVPESTVRSGSRVLAGAWAKADRGAPSGSAGQPTELAVPPERHFPVSVVIGHGVLATATIGLVLATTLGVIGN